MMNNSRIANDNAIVVDIGVPITANGIPAIVLKRNG
jgi:hypothetical protein